MFIIRIQILLHHLKEEKILSLTIYILSHESEVQGNSIAFTEEIDKNSISSNGNFSASFHFHEKQSTYSCRACQDGSENVAFTIYTFSL